MKKWKLKITEELLRRALTFIDNNSYDGDAAVVVDKEIAFVHGEDQPVHIGTKATSLFMIVLGLFGVINKMNRRLIELEDRVKTLERNKRYDKG